MLGRHYHHKVIIDPETPARPEFTGLCESCDRPIIYTPDADTWFHDGFPWNHHRAVPSTFAMLRARRIAESR